MHWVTPKGGTRTSTELPSAREASSSSENRTAVASTGRAVFPCPRAVEDHSRKAARPAVSSTRRLIAMGRFHFLSMTEKRHIPLCGIPAADPGKP